MEDPIERLRAICLRFPEATEKPSHGEPCWFVKYKRLFVFFSNEHHGGRLSFWCAAPPGIQTILVESEPERFFKPPYFGHRGWIGVYLDVPVDWKEIDEIVRDAYRTVAPPKLAARV
jgi:hypothetical protein